MPLRPSFLRDGGAFCGTAIAVPYINTERKKGPGGCRGPKCYWGLLIVGAVQEGDDLGAVAGTADTELGGGDAVGDAVLDSPGNSGAVELARNHIGEGHLCGGGGAAHGAPQEGDDLSAVAQAKGPKVSAVRPLVMPFSTAHRTAL